MVANKIEDNVYAGYNKCNYKLVNKELTYYKTTVDYINADAITNIVKQVNTTLKNTLKKENTYSLPTHILKLIKIKHKIFRKLKQSENPVQNIKYNELNKCIRNLIQQLLFKYPNIICNWNAFGSAISFFFLGEPFFVGSVAVSYPCCIVVYKMLL